jgi:hypothetical protein
MRNIVCSQTKISVQRHRTYFPTHEYRIYLLSWRHHLCRFIKRTCLHKCLKFNQNRWSRIWESSKFYYFQPIRRNSILVLECLYLSDAGLRRITRKYSIWLRPVASAGAHVCRQTDIHTYTAFQKKKKTFSHSRMLRTCRIFWLCAA